MQLFSFIVTHHVVHCIENHKVIFWLQNMTSEYVNNEKYSLQTIKVREQVP